MVESCGFIQVAVGTSCFILRNYEDGGEPLVVSQGCQASFLVARDTLGFFSSCDRGIGTHIELRPNCQRPFPVETAILRVCIDFPGKSGIISG